MSKSEVEISHKFTRTEIKLALELLTKAIKKHFGEVWQIKSDGEYKGVTWDCRSPLLFDSGVWYLCQQAKHRGAFRAAGRIESRDTGHMLRFTIFYNPKPD
jgi:hypothetical protein